MEICPGHSRRQFLKMTMAGGTAVAAAGWVGGRLMGASPAPGRGPGMAPGAVPGGAAAAAKGPVQVALTAGEDRADMAFQGLKVFEKEIAAAIGDKRVILKPNNVVNNNQLAASDAKNLEGILEFLKSIGKSASVVIAESGAMGATLDGFANYGYNKLAEKYGAKLMDLDQEAFEIMTCINETDMKPRPCRMSKILLDRNNYIISAAKLKSHDTVVATLSLKNIVVGAPSLAGQSNDKRLIHGGGPYGINFNLANFATRARPDLAVIDGYQGMEGNGPVMGTPVEHRVCVVSPNWLAADRVGIELMGIDFATVGYLNFCGQNGMGETDLSKIEIVGPALKDHIKKYKLSANIDQQLKWMEPFKKA